jgi:4-carboxymuconolactone decarboxylase
MERSEPTMPERYPPFDPDALPADARAVHDRILGERGYVPGPYFYWLAAPGFTDRMEPIEKYLRYEVSFEERIVEVAVLTIARHWRARYVWTSHAPAAIRAGVDAAIVEAIRAGATPVFGKADEATCFAFCAALIGGGEVDDVLWAPTRDTFGERGIAEIMGLIGLYSAVCATMVAYRVPTKAGEPDPFA